VDLARAAELVGKHALTVLSVFYSVGYLRI